MAAAFDVVVSCENNHYLAWQAMLFHYSCVTRLKRAPIVVVHGDNRPLLAEFLRIRAKGGRIQRAPSFRRVADVDYPPRNTAGTLLCVDSQADYILLCDPDFVFLRRLPLASFRLNSNQITFEETRYMVVGRDTRPFLEGACRRAGVSISRLKRAPIPGGVPHIIPAPLKERLAREWLECEDLFLSNENGHTGGSVPWVATMWGLVLAVHRLELNAVITRLGTTNFEGNRPLPSNGRKPAFVHYTYGDAQFDKRWFTTKRRARRTVWQACASPDTLNGTVCGQLRAAAKFFGLDRPRRTFCR
jgi:hypothetical protein